MIRVTTSTSAAAAKSYFGSGLQKADYYTEEIIGKWHGKAAELLGLSGEVQEEEFARLVDNRHPRTGEQLTPRMNASRTAGWDINFHAPKSFSLVFALNGDNRLLAIFRQSVVETMTDIEAQTHTRVRKQGVSKDRLTGNFVWAEFVHLTSRPIDNEPDVHVHCHAWVNNVSFSTEEHRWKAAKISAARRDMPLHQAAFHSRLASKVAALGYPIKRTRQGWEIGGVERSLIERFSRRTLTIEGVAARRGITRNEDKDKLGALTREKKTHGLSMQQLTERWNARLSPAESKQFQHLTTTGPSFPEIITPEQAFNHALEKCFARDAVIRKTSLLAEALRYGVGQVSREAIETEYHHRPMIEQTKREETLCSHESVLSEEITLINAVRDGKGRFSALKVGAHRFSREFLSEEQRKAVEHILRSNDRFIAVRGAAGTGKTTALSEAVEAIQAEGYHVFPLAPSAEASRATLREAGFANADTVAQFIHNPKLHRAAQGQVVWIDEAGMLGTRELNSLVDKAGEKTRFILTGDYHQHGPVARGSPFYNLEKFAGLRPAEITEIRRQKPEVYRAAVFDLSQGDLKSAMLKLDAMGAIREIPDPSDRYRQLAEDYLSLSSSRSKPLVVSPTRAEGAQATKAIRELLKENEQLKNEKPFFRLRNLHLEVAERREPENYAPGQVIQYHQNGKGVKRSERFHVQQVTEAGEILLKESQEPLSLEEADKFQVFAKEPIALAQGERIRFTRNGTSTDGRRIDNGQIREIKAISSSGDLILTTGAIVGKDYGHWNHGYSTTSHSSQSKSVKDVLIAQSTSSIPASSMEQFYVSVSRAKERVILYIDDRTALQESVGISRRQASAIELARATGRKWNDHLESELNRTQWRESVRSQSKTSRNIPSIRSYLTNRKNLATEAEKHPRRAHHRQSKRDRSNPRRGMILQQGFNRAKAWMSPALILRSSKAQLKRIRTFAKQKERRAKQRIASIKSKEKIASKRPLTRR